MVNRSRTMRGAALGALFSVVLWGCPLAGETEAKPGEPRDGAGRLVAACWNVQALFDGTEDGAEYDEYVAEAGWTDAKYRARLERVEKAVGEMAEGGPDLLALVEVENEGVLKDLAEGALRDFGYRWTAFASLEGAALGLGVLSRLPIESALSHGASRLGEETPRPTLEVRVSAEGAPLVLFVAHWKSKLGGEAETEPLRRAAAEALARRVGELEAEEPRTAVLALGDLNENWDEFVRRGGAEATALLPDDGDAAAAVLAADGSAERTVVVLAAERPPSCASVPQGIPFYTPWPESEYRGSYAYRGRWETIDHALLARSLFDGAGWDYADFRVAETPGAVDGRGFPIGYDPRSGAGLSDHLPIVVDLTLVP
jgi:endonuclease/exonuclease/phosphatase family metal-dependent hydrolase